MLDAIDYYNSAGGIVVFAAGNDNSESCYYPGCYDGVVGVAALDDSGVRASFSNYGDWVDISAPGDPVPGYAPTPLPTTATYEPTTLRPTKRPTYEPSRAPSPRDVEEPRMPSSA